MSTLLGRTAVVSGIRIFYLGLWFVAITVAYRHLGTLPDGIAQVGLLTFALASIKMVTTALGDPLDLDVVRRVPPILAADPHRAVQAWRAAQQIRTGLAAAVFALAVLLAVPIARVFLHDREWSTAVVLAGGAAAFEFVYRGYLADCQSRERFDRLLLLEGALQGFRIVSVTALWIGGALTASSFLAAYLLSALCVCLMAYVLSDAARRRLRTFSAEASLETWRYVRWVAPALMVSAVVERLDIFLLTSLRGPAEAGFYGALMPLLLVPEMVMGFAMVVLQPRVADLAKHGGGLELWSSVCRLTVPLSAVASLVVFLFAEPLIRMTIGPAYLQSVPVFKLLFVAVMCWFAVVPVALSFVVMMQPRATLVICLFQAVVVGTAGFLLIPAYGATGAAVSVFVMRLLTGVVICGAAYHRLRGGFLEGRA